MKLLPEVMPDNFTFNKVREILCKLVSAEQGKLLEAIEAAGRLKIRGPLAIVIFIKHHLEGSHEVEIDRLEESEEGTRFAVLVYPEGELPIQSECLPQNTDAGIRLSYDPAEGRYS
jgi:hypothetical protein